MFSCSMGSWIIPSSDFNVWVLFTFLHILADLWKKAVLESPSFNHLHQTLYLHIISSVLYISSMDFYRLINQEFSSTLRNLVTSIFSRESISPKILDFCSWERSRHLFSYRQKTLRRCHNLIQKFLIASSAEVWCDQLSLMISYTSLCSSYHFSKWNLLCQK